MGKVVIGGGGTSDNRGSFVLNESRAESDTTWRVGWLNVKAQAELFVLVGTVICASL